MRSTSNQAQSWLNWPTLIALALSILAFANAAMYISHAGIPFVTSDGWYFVDAFLQKYYNGGIDLQDLYVKRSLDDHAQPIQKLLLIWNADHFDLDFVIESYVGLAFAAAAWLLVFIAAYRDNTVRHSSHWWTLPITASAFSFVSLSGGMAFNWSLVTLGYLGPLAMVGLALAAWQSVENGRWWPLLLLGPFITFTLDTSGFLCVLSLTFTLLLRLLKQRGAGWRSTAGTLSLLAASVLLYRYVSAIYLYPDLAQAAQTDEPIKVLAGYGWESLLKMMLSIAALSVADRDGFITGLGPHAHDLHLGLGIIVATGHAWFWWRAMRDRWNSTQFLAVTIMLFCYGAVAGIIVERIPTFGTEYVFQQRYLMLYQCGTVALAVMAAGSSWSEWPRWEWRAATFACISLIILQIPLSRETWRAVPYVQIYANNLGRQIILLGHDPTMRLASCAPTLVICQAGRDEQIRSIELLRRRRLNAFSDEMLERHSMQTLRSPPGPVEMVPAP